MGKHHDQDKRSKTSKPWVYKQFTGIFYSFEYIFFLSTAIACILSLLFWLTIRIQWLKQCPIRSWVMYFPRNDIIVTVSSTPAAVLPPAVSVTGGPTHLHTWFMFIEAILPPIGFNSLTTYISNGTWGAAQRSWDSDQFEGHVKWGGSYTMIKVRQDASSLRPQQF